MKELSLSILDIAMNSVRAEATEVKIELVETKDTLKLTISDNGTGMTKDVLQSVTNPFCTTRKTRKIGLGIPLLKLAAEQTGGSLEIESKHIDDYPSAHGTITSATFFKNHIDFTPLGDIASSITTLIQGSPDIDFHFVHKADNGEVEINTAQIRQVLGEDVPLNCYEVIKWIGDSLNEQYSELIK